MAVMVGGTWVQDPLFPLWWEGALVKLRDGKDGCCYGRVERVQNSWWVLVSWSWVHVRSHARVVTPQTVHESRLVYQSF